MGENRPGRAAEALANARFGACRRGSAAWIPWPAGPAQGWHREDMTERRGVYAGNFGDCTTFIVPRHFCVSAQNPSWHERWGAGGLADRRWLPRRSGALCDRLPGGQPGTGFSTRRTAGELGLNLGMAQARGTYLSFVDADDWLPADALETCIVPCGRPARHGGGRPQPGGDGWAPGEPWRPPRRRLRRRRFAGGFVDRLLGERMGKPGEVLHGFVWRFLFSGDVQRGTILMAFKPGRIWRTSSFCWSISVMPRSWPWWTSRCTNICKIPCPPAVSAGLYADLSGGFMKAQGGPAHAWAWGKYAPLGENSYWSGLLIAIGK